MSILIDNRPLVLALLNRIDQRGGAVAAAELAEFCVSAAESEAWSAVVKAGFVARNRERWLLCDEAAQYVARDDWDAQTLEFLPQVITNLHTRRAFLTAGQDLIDEFITTQREGVGEEYVRREIVPPAFAAAVDADLALRLYAAASALVTRLADGAPACCIAEEVVAVRLCALAGFTLGDLFDTGHLSADEHEKAMACVADLWDLLADDDVSKVEFGIYGPTTAALAAEYGAHEVLLIADPPQAWFEPYWDMPITGHLRRADIGDDH